MELRGRHRKYLQLEKEILKILKESKNGVGFRELFLKLSNHDPKNPKDPKSMSKSTLSSALKLLKSQNKITKKANGKYIVTPTLLLLSDIIGLKKLLDSLDELIPKLKSEENAYIGIKLWTVIFQNEFHPITMFMDDSPYFRISNNVSRPIREKAAQEFFESRNHPSIFEDEMYELFFNFCAKFSSPVLDSVFNEIHDSVQNATRSTDKNFKSLARIFNKEIFVTNNMITTFYGAEFCKILLEKRPDACNIHILELLKKKNMFQEIKTIG
jgi:hypothetical protein